MVEMITQVNNAINGVVWGPFGLALLFCTGFWMSARWRSHSQFNKRQISRVIHLDGSFIDPDICADFSRQLIL